MLTVKMYNLDSEPLIDLEINSILSEQKLNNTLIWEAVHEYRARGRKGTVATKTRGDVSGSGRKLWKQKGTGRARVSSLRSPLWKGGGNVHGPQPRDWSYTLPRKKRWKAIATAFAERIREGAVVVVDDLNLPSHKTKLFRSKLCALGLLDRHKVLILDSTENRNLLLASRNLEGVKLINSLGLNIYDLLLHEKILISQRALTALTECLTRILQGQ
ncbi:50S ribosomal protein L4 [Chloracidobacterium sp. D]|jgi:large subunit ribosomal protein L4|nr:50S ribosomal protein L4 [Chloracidobacterium sp. D]QUV81053.1 50S ribosomal protein L4 [Chloracidobacterium sp. D]